MLLKVVQLSQFKVSLLVFYHNFFKCSFGASLTAHPNTTFILEVKVGRLQWAHCRKSFFISDITSCAFLVFAIQAADIVSSPSLAPRQAPTIVRCWEFSSGSGTEEASERGVWSGQFPWGIIFLYRVQGHVYGAE